ncbi:hypothetical protein K525DRAFT_200969 [Schizophyllum commune Loenen D]|nr:hypothetical protein K525DRAFT_200969 [Schizophyllum commune Loenen D]
MSTVLVGPTDPLAFLEGFVWVELHLMAFETKNQIVGLDEDKLSKPDRPIPSGRISPESTQILYVCLVLASLLMSARHGLLVPSAIYLTAIVAYNECSLARNWFFKSGQAQDFRDREGDAAIGRKTLALLLPQAVGRWSLGALLVAWTGVLVWFWMPPATFSCALLALAITTTSVFVSDYSHESDRRGYWWYNMWLISCHALPIFHRLRG